MRNLCLSLLHTICLFLQIFGGSETVPTKVQSQYHTMTGVLLSEKKTRGKFTTEQRDFLLSKVPDFRNAQQNSCTRAFLSALYSIWFEKWPLAEQDGDANGEPDNADDSGEDSPPTPRQEMMKVSISPLAFTLEDLHPCRGLRTGSTIPVSGKYATTSDPLFST